MSRSKVVELSNKKFDIRKLPPEVGSFILMRMMGVSVKMMRDEPPIKHKEAAPAPTEVKPPEKISGETHVRLTAFTVLSGGVAFEDFTFIQASCMKVISCYNAAGFAMPIMSDSGEWTKDVGEDVADDVGLVMKLTTEVLVFCFADFFESGSLGV